MFGRSGRWGFTHIFKRKTPYYVILFNTSKILMDNFPTVRKIKKLNGAFKSNDILNISPLSEKPFFFSNIKDCLSIKMSERGNQLI